MATLSELRISISTIIQNLAYTNSMLTSRINGKISEIAAGIRMPNGEFSYSLPDLYSSATVKTATDAAYKTLGLTYQRNVFMVVDDNGDKILPPNGGDYYSFGLFLDNITEKDLSETGSIYRVAVKGSNLYYQAIPTVSEDLIVMFYRKPVAIALDTDTPDGLPDHLQDRLIKHGVSKDIFGENINNDSSAPKKAAYHKVEFFKAMRDLLDFIGQPDATPVYYQSTGLSSADLGICD